MIRRLVRSRLSLVQFGKGEPAEIDLSVAGMLGGVGTAAVYAQHHNFLAVGLFLFGVEVFAAAVVGRRRFKHFAIRQALRFPTATIAAIYPIVLQHLQ